MDGTINLGNELIPGMEGFFDKLKAAGREYYLLTNNSSRDHQHCVNKMNGLGVPVTRENVLISTDAFTNYMSKNHPNGKFYVLGTPQLEQNIADAGLTMTKTLEEGADLLAIGSEVNVEKVTAKQKYVTGGYPDALWICPGLLSGETVF